MTISCTLSWTISAVTLSSRWLVIGLVGLHLTSQLALSQRSSATCTTDWKWTNNKADESPCDVAAQLLSLCDSNPSSFQLPSEGSYMPSSSSSIQANTCSCNVVAYNLLMACQACQKGSTTNSISTWEQYGKSCGICSTENGISPGPCHKQSNPGFPGTVRPNKGNIGVPLWALENTSGSSWNVAAARKIASAGQEKTITAPTSANPSDKDSGDEKSNKTNSNKEAFAPGNERMKGAVIACVCLAALILTGFIAYLLRVCYNKRKVKKLKEFNDSAFDKVIPTKRESNSEKFGSGLAAPLKLNLRNMMARITEAVPRTPRTPRTPGMAEPPSTPLTARFWAFRKSDTKKLKTITEGDETEALAEKSVRFQQEGGHDTLRRKTLSRRYVAPR